MKPHKFAKLTNRHAGDRVKVSFNIPSNVYLMTADNYECYKNNNEFIRIFSQGSIDAFLDVPFDGEWYLVIEACNNYKTLECSYNITPVVGTEWNDVTKGSVIVHNVPNTSEKDITDMADYWEEQKGYKLSGNDLICRSCHQKVKRSDIDGTHVRLSHITKSKLYVVPTCNSCNRSKQDKDFIVPSSWLVEAP